MKEIKNQYDYLANVYYIKSTPQMEQISEIAHRFYNCVLYQLRQRLFKHQRPFSYPELNALFKNKASQNENLLYRQFPYVQSAQQTIKEVTTIWKAWFAALNSYRNNPSKFTGRPRIPKYLKRSTKHVFYITNQNAHIKNGYLWIPKLNFRLKLAQNITKIQRVIFKPVSNGYFKVIVPYKTTRDIDYKPDNGKYVSIDSGIDNAFVCVSNTNHRPLIINGRSLKSVNQFYNKKKAELQALQAKYHQLETIINTKQGEKSIYKQTKAQLTLTNWRNKKIMTFAHKASKCIVNYALNCDANTIIIGKNNNGKRSSNMGKKNNQNFIGIPHTKMIDLITYKANLAGITVITTNESYTSQTSFLDNEKPCWQNGNKSRKKQGLSPINRRIHRGLFKSNHNYLINADVNGAYQIMRKVFPNVSFNYGIEGLVFSSVKWSPLI